MSYQGLDLQISEFIKQYKDKIANLENVNNNILKENKNYQQIINDNKRTIEALNIEYKKLSNDYNNIIVMCANINKFIKQ